MIKHKTLLFEKVIIILLLITITGLQSCGKSELNRIGFDVEFTPISKGLTVIYVDEETTSLILHGSITLDEGNIIVEFINNKGITVYEMTYNEPGIYSTSETFVANKGYWKLKYRSLEGSGELFLHADLY